MLSVWRCWHCQVSTVSTSLLPLFTFLPICYYISEGKYSLSSPGVGLYSVQLPLSLHTDMSLWLSHTRAWRSSGSHKPGAIPQHLIPLSCEPHPSPFHPDAEWHHILLPTAQPFSHTTPDLSTYFLASDCWLTPSQLHWGCDSDLLLVARTHILMNIWKEYFRHYNFDRGSKGIITAPTRANLFTVCVQPWFVAEVCVKEMKQRYPRLHALAWWLVCSKD